MKIWQFRKAFEDIENNFHYENYKVKEIRKVKLTKELHEQANLTLFQKQEKEARDESYKQIKKLSNDIEIGCELPAIVLVDCGDYYFIADGNHRVIALYEKNKRQYPAIIIERDEE